MSDYGKRAFKNVLESEFKKRKKNNPSYSLRAFARDLGTSHVRLSSIFAGDINVSREFIEKLLPNLSLGPFTTKRLLSFFPSKKKQAQKETVSFEELKTSRDQMPDEWFYDVICTMPALKDFRSDPDWIAKRLGVSKQNAEDAIEYLIKTGKLEYKDSGKLSTLSRGGAYHPGQIPVAALRKLKHQHIRIADNAVDDYPSEDACIVSAVLPASRDKLPEAKKMIVEFLGNLSTFLAIGDADEVYMTAVQLVPMTKKSNK